MQETYEMQIRSLGGEDPPEKEMPTHASMLACRIPWTEEPEELQSMGSQRVDTTEATYNTVVAKPCDYTENTKLKERDEFLW